MLIVFPLALALLLASSAAAQPASKKAAAPKPDPWKLTFSDEFEGSAVEFPKWSPHDPWGKERNLEVQAYTPESVSLADGKAKLTARISNATYDGRKREYTSGMMTTYGSFAQRYGKWEIRCRVPSGKGLEAKVWLLPVPNGELPSVDVMAFLGRDPGRVNFANFWGDKTTVRAYEGGWPLKDLKDAFHTYAVEWDRDKIVWFVDGVERFRSTTGVPQQPMYLAMSLAVGGELAKWPDSTTSFPAAFEIDFVRVYQKPD